MRRFMIIVVMAGAALGVSLWAWISYRHSPDQIVLVTGRPVTAFRVNPGFPTSDYEKYIVEQRELGTEAGDRVAAVLGNEANFSGHGARCFSPGLAFRLGSGDDAQHAVICLLCHKVVFRRGDNHAVRGLTDQGLRELRQLYDEFFPTASQPTTASTQITPPTRAGARIESTVTSLPLPR